MKIFITKRKDKSILLSIPEPIFQGEKELFVGNCILYIEIKDESDPKDKYREHDLRFLTYTTISRMLKLETNKPVALEIREWPKLGEQSNCENCGAPLKDGKCSYCGTQFSSIFENPYKFDRDLGCPHWIFVFGTLGASVVYLDGELSPGDPFYELVPIRIESITPLRYQLCTVKGINEEAEPVRVSTKEEVEALLNRIKQG